MTQMGKIMDTDAGNISSSSKSDMPDSSGTSTIPPPAPNMPFTIPAPNPLSAVPIFFAICIMIPPAIQFPYMGDLYRETPCCHCSTVFCRCYDCEISGCGLRVLLLQQFREKGSNRHSFWRYPSKWRLRDPQ